MTIPSSDNTINNIASNDIACIYSQNNSDAFTIREFLSTHGIEVLVNESRAYTVRYLFIIGVLDYVKDILAKNPQNAEKSFIILLSSIEGELQQINANSTTKVVAVSDEHIPSRYLQELFAFFFTGKEKRKILGILPADRNSPAQVAQTSDRSFFQKQGEDQKRIEETIKLFFDPKKDQKKLKRKRSALPSAVIKSFFILIFLFLSPLIFYGILLTVSTILLVYGGVSLKRGDMAMTQWVARNSLGWISNAKSTLDVLEQPFVLAGRGDVVRNQQRLLAFYTHMSASLEGVGRMQKEGKEIIEYLLTPADIAVSNESYSTAAVAINNFRQDVRIVEQEVGQGQSALSALQKEDSIVFTLPVVREYAERVLTQLDTVYGALSSLDKLLILYPEIAGFTGDKTYLLAFQNSMELRPTGGFIGSVGILTLSNGRMEDFIIRDVYELDGQLKGHVDPPDPIRYLMNQEHWYLRDANWDPDFFTTATHISWFYEKETGKTVDGVIAISVPLLVDILRATGPIEVPQINDRITADNFFGKSLFYTKTDFFPGSTQKKDFLGDLASVLMGKITSTKGVSTVALYQAFRQALKRGDILFMFEQPNAQQLAESFGWSGKVPVQLPCLRENETPTCITETVLVNEANLGVNKVNFYLTRHEDHHIVIDESGRVRHAISIDYQNNSTNDDPTSGGGSYLAYTRFYIPKGANVTNIALDETLIKQRQEPGETAQELPYFEEDRTNEKASIFGAAYTVASAETKKMQLTYEHPMLLPAINGEREYVLQIQKQPGLINTTISVTIEYPPQWKLSGFPITTTDDSTQHSVENLANAGQFRYNTALTSTISVRMQFRE